MENQHRKIKGYRELTQEEIDLMNEIKQKGAELEAMLDGVRHVVGMVPGSTEEERNSAGESLRWVAISQTHFQQGLMALTRAVAKPEFF